MMHLKADTPIALDLNDEGHEYSLRHHSVEAPPRKTDSAQGDR